jgi:hypothetical protein
MKVRVPAAFAPAPAVALRHSAFPRALSRARAFAPPLPVGQRTRACATHPAVPAAEAPAPPPAPLWTDPASVTPASRALREALATVLRGDGDVATVLDGVLTPACTWSAVVVDADDRPAIVKALGEFLGFALDPVILFTGEVEEANGGARLEWLLSFTYPTPWRPRVTISGRSVLTLDAGKGRVVRIVDDWDASPWTVIRQALPRAADIVWLYPAPHAELDIGTRRQVSRRQGYQIVRVAARPEMLVHGDLSEPEKPLVTAVPAVPAHAFVGGLRRKEDYSTVSPVSVRHLGGDRYEWAVAVPGTIFGSSKATPLVPHPSSDVRYVMSPARHCAVVRYGGYAVAELFEAKVAQLVAMLQADGYLPAGQEVDRTRVWSRQYDSKIGFNGASEVAIGTCGGAGYGVPPRWNELLIELPELDARPA